MNKKPMLGFQLNALLINVIDERRKKDKKLINSNNK